MKSFRVSLNSHAIDLASGRMVGPGEETGPIDPKDEHHKELIESGVLLPADPQQAPKAVLRNTETKED
jgi:hypothetical protein